MNRTGRILHFSPWPILMVLVAIGMAAGVFTVTQKVQRREAQVAELNHRLLSEQQTLRVLDAEWAYLTRPQRLESLMALKAGKDDMPPVPAPIATIAPAAEAVIAPAAVPAEKPAQAPGKKITVVSVKKEIPDSPKKAAPKTAPKSSLKNDVWPIARKDPAPSRSAHVAPLPRVGVAHPILE